MGAVRRNDAGDGGLQRRFLSHVAGKRELSQSNGTWETQVAEEVLRAAGGKSTAKYIGCWQVMVAHLVSLLPPLEFCER